MSKLIFNKLRLLLLKIFNQKMVEPRLEPNIIRNYQLEITTIF